MKSVFFFYHNYCKKLLKFVNKETQFKIFFKLGFLSFKRSRLLVFTFILVPMALLIIAGLTHSEGANFFYKFAFRFSASVLTVAVVGQVSFSLNSTSIYKKIILNQGLKRWFSMVVPLQIIFLQIFYFFVLYFYLYLSFVFKRQILLANIWSMLYAYVVTSFFSAVVGMIFAAWIKTKKVLLSVSFFTVFLLVFMSTNQILKVSPTFNKISFANPYRYSALLFEEAWVANLSHTTIFNWNQLTFVIPENSDIKFYKVNLLEILNKKSEKENLTNSQSFFIKLISFLNDPNRGKISFIFEKPISYFELFKNFNNLPPKIIFDYLKQINDGVTSFNFPLLLPTFVNSYVEKILNLFLLIGLSIIGFFIMRFLNPLKCYKYD